MRNEIEGVCLTLFVALILMWIFSSCTIRRHEYRNYRDKLVHHIEDAHNIVDGRKTYNVFFMDGKALEFMYDEEIVHGITTGVWGYNEDIKK